MENQNEKNSGVPQADELTVQTTKKTWVKPEMVTMEVDNIAGSGSDFGTTGFTLLS